MAKKKSKLGRKPLEDPAERFIIYPRKSWLKLLGKDEAKKTAEDAIEQKAKKKTKN
jgi:hypothetical protein